MTEFLKYFVVTMYAIHFSDRAIMEELNLNVLKSIDIKTTSK